MIAGVAMRDNKKSGPLSKVQKLKKRLSQSFGKLGKRIALYAIVVSLWHGDNPPHNKPPRKESLSHFISHFSFGAGKKLCTVPDDDDFVADFASVFWRRESEREERVEPRSWATQRSASGSNK